MPRGAPGKARGAAENGPGGVSGSGGKGGRGGGGGGAFAEYRDKTCGDFNLRNGCGRGPGCRFEHVYRGCGSRSHGLYECEKTNRGRRERSPDGRAGDRTRAKNR